LIHFYIATYLCEPNGIVAGKPNGIVMTEELREELNQAALATSQAYAGARATAPGDAVGAVEEAAALVLQPGSAIEDMIAEKLERHREREDQNKLSIKVLVMQPILRFLQLLCENHNRDLQVHFFGPF
jgi:inositol 1,4,5-triphosphate receptor type 1